jgi:hypothetical protein
MESFFPEDFMRTSSNRFRDVSDFQTWHMKQFYYQHNYFIPGVVITVYLGVTRENIKSIVQKISNLNGNVDFVCLNDKTNNDPQGHTIKKPLSEALEKIFPNKSSFETTLPAKS